MLATANDILLYQTLLEYCKVLNLEIRLTGDGFRLFNITGDALGTLHNLSDLSHYIYGYEAGFSKGKNIKTKKYKV